MVRDALMDPFTLGAIGALAPEIVRLYKWRTKRAPTDFSGTYFVLSILYAALGGIVATLLSADGSEITSLYIGAALPFVLDTGIRNVAPRAESDGTPTDVEEAQVRRVTWREELSAFASALGR